MGFGEHLRRLREGAGLSRAELARRAGAPASTLRLLRDLRGGPQPVFVQNAGQVNVGQQVNLAPPAGGRNGAARPREEGRRPRSRSAARTCPADRRSLIGEGR
jgi:transcriptional regulator with XRE-family HTH domain